MLYIILLASACLCVTVIAFSIRYHNRRGISLLIAGGVSAGALGIVAALFRQLPGMSLEVGLIPAGGWFTGWLYGLVYGQRDNAQEPNKGRKHKFYLTCKSGKRIYFGDPCDNFLVYAGANAGKTQSLGKPLLEQYIMNGWAGFVYDFKDYDYSRTSWNLAQKHNYPYAVCPVNFVDPSTSLRVNPIKPSVLKDEVLLIQLMDDLLSARLGDGDRNEWFFGALGILKGVAYRFYCDYPKYCTIPHIANYIVQAGEERLDKFLREKTESRALAAGFLDAAGSERTRASILFTLTNHLSDLTFNKKLQYVLTGDDFDFNIIDPAAPKLVMVANSHSIESIISPVISIMVTMASRSFSLANQVDCFFLFDEGTTLKIPNFEKMPSVLREYRCSFTFLTQSGAKIEKLYGKLDRSSIESNFANVFIGRTKDTEALKTYGLLFSRRDENRRTYTTGHNNHGSSHSTSVSKTKEQRYEPYFYTTLTAGEFVGSAAHSNSPEFHQKFRKYDPGNEKDLPIFRLVLDTDIEENYRRIIENLSLII